ncbi:MAG: maleylpyruvate isomerase N-terminal domain-containing protein [Acidimicrobiales bacterium]
MAEPNKAKVEGLYRAGVEAIATITSTFGADEWANPACGDWSAADTARHLVAVANWYHDWLDRALAGRSDAPFGEAEFDSRNSAGVAGLQDIDGPEAVVLFSTRANEYLDRALTEWQLPFGYPAGTVTVGLHVGIAATEWHLHAWDLAGRTNQYSPADPAELLIAAGLAVAKTKGGLGGRLLALGVPLAAKRSPWDTLLKESGRR